MKLSKKLIQPGRPGSRPHFWSRVRLVVSYSPGVPADEVMMEMRIGTATTERMRSAQLAAQLMDEGEVSEFSTSQEFVITLRLVEVLEQAEPVTQWDACGILAAAGELKEAGVSIFSEGRHADSFFLFSQAVKMLIPLDVEWTGRSSGSVDATTNQATVNLLIAQLYGNMAACHLAVNAYEQALWLSVKVLERLPDNTKGLYRKASALVGECLFTINSVQFNLNV